MSLHFRLGLVLLLAMGVPCHGETLTEKMSSALAAGATYLRVTFIANDEEAEAIHEAMEEAEHAIEPPMQVEGFFRRKWELLGNPAAAFDLRRSFQNVARLTNLARDFENPWLREMMLSAATMFALTHGSEVVVGGAMGLWSLATLDLAQSAGWFGLAFPGLYDVGCWIGFGTLLLRPTRILFNETRKAAVIVASAAGKKLGTPLLLEALFEHRRVREALAEALQSPKPGATLELVIPDSELLRFQVRNAEGREVLSLRFQQGTRNDLVLHELVFEPKTLGETKYRDIAQVLGGFGWNVLGVIRQIRKLVLRGQSYLIEEEKTFVSSVESSPELVSVQVRPGAVYYRPYPRLRTERSCPKLLHSQGNLGP